MGPLRVCRVINSMWTGGVQVRLLALLPLLKARGCEAEVLVLRSRGELARRLEELGIPCTLIRVEGRINPISVWTVRRFLVDRRFDVVHTHMYQANATGTIAARLAGVPCIVSQAHNVDMYVRRRQAWTDRLLLPWRDRYVAVSDAVRRDVSERLGVAPSRLGVIHNGIDPRPSPAVRPRGEVLESLQLPADAVVVVQVARLHRQKNHAGFLREFPRILERVPRARLLIVGHGRERRPLQDLAASLGIQAEVLFLGRRTDVPDLLNAADISILPSHKEGFSNVALESMVYRAALVATDVGGAREMIRDGMDGFVVPASDMTAFRDRVVQLALEPALRASLAESAAQRVAEFSIERMADRTMQLYEEVLRGKGKWGERRGARDV